MLYRNCVVTLIACAILFAGCQPQDNYTTTLSVTRGLKAGDPVIHDGRRIGTVNAVRSMPDGKSQVGFAVEPGHTDEVREDSIAIVSEDSGAPALKLVSPTAVASRPVPPGSSIPGAGTEAEATLLAAREALKSLAAGATDALQDLNANLEGLNKSPAWDEFHRDFQEVQRQMAMAGTQAREILDKQLPRLRRELYNLETRLRVEGNSAEAERLRRDLERLARNLAASPTPSPHAD
jgi:ABC-type transporter Mla subunit MlaD